VLVVGGGNMKRRKEIDIVKSAMSFYIRLNYYCDLGYYS